jgi:electron transfer flavoprotein beta subunit
MKIVVCVKHCPDAQGDRTLTADHTTDRENVDGLLSELDEYAVEEALKLKESADAEVVALTMGPDGAIDAIRKALQMGADSGVHVCDDALHGSDAPATSLVLAKAVQQIGDVDLVLMGMSSTDAAVTYASTMTIDGSTVTIGRDGDASTETISASLPAVVSVTDHINEPRYPSFKGIMAAKKKKVETLSIADLGVEAGDVGLDAAWTRVDSFAARPPRQAGQIVPDEGDGGLKLAEFLAAGKFV